jgi:hypothetical protein
MEDEPFEDLTDDIGRHAYETQTKIDHTRSLPSTLGHQDPGSMPRNAHQDKRQKI